MPDTTTRRFRITGRVQGVGFRAWTKARADRLGLRGWVRNRPDGSVEAHLGGAEEALAAMTRAFRDGPEAARVTDVRTASSAEPLPEGVEIRR